MGWFLDTWLVDQKDNYSRHLINRVVFLCPIYLLFVILDLLIFFFSLKFPNKREIYLDLHK